jgi:hypothetical protein
MRLASNPPRDHEILRVNAAQSRALIHIKMLPTSYGALLPNADHNPSNNGSDSELREIAFIEEVDFDRPQPVAYCTGQTSSEFTVAIA